MEERQRAAFIKSRIGLITSMSDGNIGALTVIDTMMTKDPEMLFTDLLSLDDMNIRGSQLYVGYNDFAGRDINKFIAAIRSRSQEMVDVINRECGNQDGVAVTHGHSFNRG